MFLCTTNCRFKAYKSAQQSYLSHNIGSFNYLVCILKHKQWTYTGFQLSVYTATDIVTEFRNKIYLMACCKNMSHYLCLLSRYDYKGMKPIRRRHYHTATAVDWPIPPMYFFVTQNIVMTQNMDLINALIKLCQCCCMLSFNINFNHCLQKRKKLNKLSKVTHCYPV